MSIVLLLLIMAGLVFYCMPPGDLPMRAQSVPRVLWLVLILILWVCLLTMLFFSGPRRFRWVRVIALMLLASAVTIVIILTAPKVAARRLCKYGSVTPSTMAMYLPHGRTGAYDAFLSWLQDHGVPIHPAIRNWPSLSRDENEVSLEVSLLGCRWSTRKAFVAAMLDDPQRASMLVTRWTMLFHAIVNQDVDLSHRRELLGMLDQVRESTDSSPEARRAASFWMGLIFLTDPQEFMEERIRIRDAVLGESDPPYDASSDGWMRLADCLLSFEDPSDWTGLTANYASNKSLLRRATRERVRGMASHHEAIMTEVMDAQKRGDFNAALSLWLDAGRLAAVYPGTEGSRELGARCADALIEWASAPRVEGVLKAYVDFNKTYGMTTPEAELTVVPETQERLAELASAWACRALETEGGDAKECLEVATLLWPMLAETQQSEVAVKLAPALLRDPCYLANMPKRSVGTYVDFERVYWLAEVWKYFTPELHAQHREQLRRVWHEGYISKAANSGRLLWMDAWSPEPALSSEEWLLSAWVLNQGYPVPAFRRVAMGDIHDPERFKPLPVPEVEPAVVMALLDKLTKVLIEADQWRNAGDADEGAIAKRMIKQLAGEHFGGGMVFNLTKELRSLVEWDERLRSMSEGEIRQSLFESLVACGAIDYARPEYADFIQQGWGRHFDLPVPKHGAALVRACPEWWGQEMAIPDMARRNVELAIRDEQCFELLLMCCEGQSEGSLAMQEIWEVLIAHARSHSDEDVRLRAFSGLFILYPRLHAGQRNEFREEFRRFYGSRRLSCTQWEQFCPKIGFVLKGERVPWEDDALAAEWAWSSEIKSEVDLYPGWKMAGRSVGVFSYLAQACICFGREDFIYGDLLEQPISISYWQRRPLAQPLEPTPWQRARQLHLRRPDLHFPDHFPIRPKRRTSD